MQTGRSKKGLDRVISIMMVRPQDRLMSQWIKRAMWIISVVSLFPTVRLGDTRSITMLCIATLAWALSAAATRKRIHFFFDVFCVTVVSCVTCSILLNGTFGVLGAFMVLITGVIAIFLLGAFWGGIFGLFLSLFIAVTMGMPSLEWIRTCYSVTFCERFPYIAFCFTGVSLFIMYGIQEFWLVKSDYKDELAHMIENGRKERSEVSIKVLLTMYKAMATKIPIMKKHSDATGMWTREIARVMGYKGDELKTMYYAGLLHDIGKIGIPDYFWDLDELSDDEYRIYMQHVDIGYEILSNLQQQEIADAARYHHEKMDGSGYKIVKGAAIPMVARIVGVANFVVRKEENGEFDYDIIQELKQMSGEKYDSTVVEAAIRALQERMKREDEEKLFGL